MTFAGQNDVCPAGQGRDMKDETRRAVALIAGNLISGNQSGTVFDQGARRYFNFSAQIGSSISVFDYTRQCFLTGTGSGPSYSLYDYGNRKFINLSLRGNDFEGYDYDSGRHFSGTVNGQAVSVYDHQHRRYFSYSL